MKKLYSMVVGLFLITTSYAQQNGAAINCGDLFISEYVEGSGTNKALEIYNPTDNPVSLANYRLVRYSNGAQQVVAESDPAAVLPLPTNISIPSKGVYVIALNLTDPNGTGQAGPIDLLLQAKADTLLSNGCGQEPGNIRVMCFNGDDALGLQKNIGGLWVFVDIFASIGEQPVNSQGSANPPAGWSNIPPFSSMPPGYQSPPPYFLTNWTLDNTLIRKSSVKMGVFANPLPETFNPSIEWDSLPENTFDSLGTHTCECNQISSIPSYLNDRVLNVFPNPTASHLSITTTKPLEMIIITNATGQIVLNRKENGSIVTLADVQHLNAGIYAIRFIWTDGKEAVKTFIKE
jgi:hypothetical protein